jgi:formate dehydrogenase accessory protein FdhD
VVATETQLALYVNGEFQNQFIYSPGLSENLVSGYLLSSDMISNKSEIVSMQMERKECRVILEKYVTHKRDNSKQQVVFEKLLEIRNLLLESQQNHRATRGFHGAILYDLSTAQWFACEDIGRHNAVDKVIGYGLQEDYELSNSVLLISGRLLSNIVSKGTHSGIPVIASMTVATSDGIQKAREENRTLVGSLSEEGCWCYNEGAMKIVLD